MTNTLKSALHTTLECQESSTRVNGYVIPKQSWVEETKVEKGGAVRFCV